MSRLSSGRSAFWTELGPAAALYSPRQKEAFHRVNIEHLLFLQNRQQEEIAQIFSSGMVANFEDQRRISNDIRSFHSVVQRSLDGVDFELGNVNQSLMQNNRVLVDGFEKINAELKTGFQQTNQTLLNGFNITNETLVEGFNVLANHQVELIERSRDTNHHLSKISISIDSPRETSSNEFLRQALKNMRAGAIKSPVMTKNRVERLFIEASKMLDEAIREWDSNALAHFNRGWIYMFVEHDLTNSISYFEKALLKSFGQDNYLALKSARHMAEAYFQSKDYDRASLASEEAINIAQGLSSTDLSQINYDRARYNSFIDDNIAIYSLGEAIALNEMHFLNSLGEIAFQQNKKICSYLKDECTRREEDVIWSKVQHESHLEAVKAYLKSEPPPRHIEAAKVLLSELQSQHEKATYEKDLAAWNSACRQATSRKSGCFGESGRLSSFEIADIEPLNQYVTQWPQGAFKMECEENIAFRKAYKQNSSTAFSKFIKLFPNGHKMEIADKLKKHCKRIPYNTIQLPNRYKINNGSSVEARIRFSENNNIVEIAFPYEASLKTIYWNVLKNQISNLTNFKMHSDAPTTHERFVKRDRDGSYIFQKRWLGMNKLRAYQDKDNMQASPKGNWAFYFDSDQVIIINLCGQLKERQFANKGSRSIYFGRIYFSDDETKVMIPNRLGIDVHCLITEKSVSLDLNRYIISPKGNYLAYKTSNRIYRSYSVFGFSNPTVVNFFGGHTGDLVGIGFSNDEKTFATFSDDGELRLRNLILSNT